jgi:hypothetical protein
MAASAKWFTNGPEQFALGNVVWKASGGSDIRVALLTSSWTPDQDANDTWADISTYEVAAAGGYTAGGAPLTLIDAAADTGTNETRLDANDVTWSSSTITARYAVVYKYNATPSLALLLGYQDFDVDKISSSGDFKITWASSGVLKITAS